MNKFIGAILVSLLLSACSTSLPHLYTCESHQTFDAMVMSDKAIVQFNNEERSLPRIRSASGAQWESEDKKFGLYTKGQEAMLVWGDSQLRDCVLVR
ncbi:hypothetical protein A1OO_02445 [Enterovibrio norvegicus FF-33]|uniref:C-type lysozyme inhibitor domain-containing protein n=1 Tax=Enterovibrio norvegicus FF-454 TaxID=1185651 RepID=A0A1E5BWK6_9GAMM|nr:MliC family protein [Enterovibrio norvegicus]OEE57643.1 hypothetical protein A1OK_05700 [Enterovibrio norvegicus FF-454]OEE69660.1 hypothetical protein A1OO_02445 [Enterovibrio norvegicus FF-33]OEE81694.1 hypothetical protein A1OQ_04540 [Enterovibrio norvegicus FF-162]